MVRYFKVSHEDSNPENFSRRKRKGFLAAWLSKLNVTGWLIFANIILFLIFELLFGLFHVEKYIYLQPFNLFNNGYIWTLLTSMFMHANIFHLFINMLSLFFIGNFLEMIIGRKRFFWLYMISGIFAGLFFAILAFLFGNSEIGIRIFSSSETFAVGASGAIFALAGVLCFLTPRNSVYLITGPIIAIAIQAALVNFLAEGVMNFISIIVNIYIFISIFSMFSISPGFRAVSIPIKMPFWLLPIIAIVPLVIIGLFVELPIGNTAHLGGFIVGAFYGIYLRLRYKRKSQMISNYFSK